MDGNPIQVGMCHVDHHGRHVPKRERLTTEGDVTGRQRRARLFGSISLTTELSPARRNVSRRRVNRTHTI